MKTSKSPEKTEVTPSKKKLKQARLPFKLITDVSPKPDPPQPRKRKLSVPDAEPLTKVGKISKENDLAGELLVISDDDSKDAIVPDKVETIPNPLVKLVDKARKKKLQKAKALKKSKRQSKKLEKTVQKAPEPENDNPQDDDIEMVDVEVIIHEDHSKNSSPVVEKISSQDEIAKSIEKVQSHPENENILSASKETVSENKKIKSPAKSTNSIICLDDSNNSCDMKPNTSCESAANLKHKTEEPVATENKVSKPENKQKTIHELVNNVTPKRSTRIKQNSTQNDVKKVQSIESDKSQSGNDESKLTNETQNGSPQSSSESDQKNSEIKTQDKLESPNNVTPKRSSRKNTKADEKASSESSVVNSKLDTSVCSSPATPKQITSSEDVLKSPAPTNLTPKQLQKRQELAKKKEEREKEKQEREKKRLEEKEERAKQRQEKEDQKKKEREDKEEAKKKEREEKEELRKKEKEEKEKQRELEKKQKEEEKRKEREYKEEQRKKEKEAREDEKKKKQEALELEKQEQELKKKKAAEAFVNFFVPKQKNEKDQSVGPSRNSMLSSFTVKGDMRLAPLIRADLSEEKREALDKFMEEQGLSELYLKCLKDGRVKPQSSGKTWPLSDKDDDDVMIVEDELPPLDVTGEIITCDTAPREKLRPKLLSFHENRRPPYWGTWRKASPSVKPRRPFGQDEKLLDYEVDSDDDWEEEQEGESLDGSVCGSDEDGEPKDDYEVDNELFVPHGYLSDEEATMDEDDVLSLSPEAQKARLKHLEDEFESEMKKPTEKLKPRMYGLLWEDANGGKPEQCVDALWNYFSKFSMIMDDPLPHLHPSKEPEETEKKKIKKKKILEGEEASPKSEKKKKAKPENKEGRKSKTEPKKVVPNQPGINSFLFAKVKSS